MSPEADRTIWIGDDAPSIADALRGRGFQITTDPDAARIHLGDGGLALLDGESHDSLEQRIYRAFPASKLVPLSGGARLDAAAGTVALGTTSARLTATERRVLLFLAGCGAGGASAEELLHAVWGYRPGVKSRTVISTVHRIRAKLDGLGLAGLLQSMTAPAGYRLAEAAPADLLGRDRELAALERALQEPGAIALIGPGGVGKTHLASAALRRWRDGPTAAVSGARDAVDLAAALGRAWGVALTARPMETLARAARQRGGGVLLLDDCERCPEAAAALATTLIEADPALRVVLCSRRALPLEGAYQDLGPLPAAAARRLMLQEARLRRPDFADTPALTSLLARVDHLPLAIRLLAGAAAVLSVEDMALRLDGLLVGGDAADEPGVTEVIAATLGGLDEGARSAVATLALFPGPFSAADAAAVLGDGAVGPLRALQAHALIQRTGDQLSLLSLVRSAAGEPPEAGRARFLQWACGAPLPASGPAVHRAWLLAPPAIAGALARRLLPTLLDTGPIERAYELVRAHPERAAAGARLLHRQGRAAEALRLLEAPAEPPDDRVEALDRAAARSAILGESRGPEEALAALDAVAEGLAGLSASQRAELGLALVRAEFGAGRVDRSEERARELLHDLGASGGSAPEGLRLRLHLVICAARRGALAEAGALSAEVLAAARAGGLPSLTAEALHLQGICAHLAGRADDALALLAEAERQAEAAGRPRLASRAGADRGGVLIQAGRLGEAEAALRQSIWLSQRFEDRLHQSSTSGNLLALLSARGRWEEMAALLPEAKQAAEGMYNAASTRFHEATLLANTGRPAEAAALAAELLPAIAGMGRSGAAKSIQAMRAGWLLDAGRVEEAAAAAASVEPVGDAVAEALVAVVRARIARAAGDRDEAVEAAAAAVRAGPLAGMGAIRRSLSRLG